MHCLCQPSVKPSFQIYLDQEMIILDTEIHELSTNQSILYTNIYDSTTID